MRQLSLLGPVRGAAAAKLLPPDLSQAQRAYSSHGPELAHAHSALKTEPPLGWRGRSGRRARPKCEPKAR
eukprot:NODE_4585_length_786_cov_9.062415_g3810_i0.p3 GENE.NODE_4585_length_786_cov_9.062415_g3810_i0~~NODE_4585_length_786_cov_9.062415_g3810_i0.p3  ORF type:complete len:70 (-),score=2.96 NODE_4585_length_786_cov_9.062415_g3810_i0:10-219(-)